jgi:hypothetical protein
MSGESANYWTVRPSDDMMTHEMRDVLLDLMREQGLRPAEDERIPRADGRIELRANPSRPCVWDQLSDAQLFADEIAKRTRCEWIVVETYCDE